ncbi:addiction module RelE/StbE family toxin [Halanaerobium saccharolyticum]|jgi:addiction module RelE/StbE family toxin|uniref:Addiction module RelE/StbE family toxin n=1 Tax=Halanaerobium saccharolyticum TaxID=43595 RepID=A0A4R7Z2G8_9FIRM|nr:type II toxin-antitoxin system RelE/ParE family toxin [Halanaerobium saccharolyticum]RAK08107.1 addiction module RelE/StbE family toxin [Halanaerobium saccharolyticum]TDW04314.1 addiction module RelE/StbE family toxin [Halanaerobium saccharolyticum]TDX59605.1 addiction module RelE/StbE family toxin [Halanaerobium saccharolyticum]
MVKNDYSLKITKQAYNDLDNIYSYIVSEFDDKASAKNLLNKIEDKVLRLKQFPLSGSLVADQVLQNKGYRKLIINKYVAFYLVNEDENEVVIMRVLSGRQKYQDFI